MSLRFGWTELGRSRWMRGMRWNGWLKRVARWGGLVLLAGAMVSAGRGERAQLEIPENRWVENYFEAIDRLAGMAGLTNLREADLPKDHLELRLWAGFGGGSEIGFVIARKDGTWNGRQIKGRSDQDRIESKPLAPRSTWEELWQAMVSRRLLTLPDYSVLPHGPGMVMDGSCLVVETWAEGKYRTIMYPNSWAQDNLECREVEALGATLMYQLNRGDGKTRERVFFPPVELNELATMLQQTTYPMDRMIFSKALEERFRFRDRWLEMNSYSETTGKPGAIGTWYRVWPLTNRSDTRGHYLLVMSGSEADDRATLRAEIVFEDVYGQRRALTAKQFPVTESSLAEEPPIGPRAKAR